MAWVAIIAIAVVTLGLMWVTGLRGPLLTLGAAAVAFGGAGYALSGRPDAPGAEREAGDRGAPLSLAEARHRLMGEFNAADRWLIIADSFERRGKTEEAVGLLRNAVANSPGDYQLWVGLGNALADHARSYTPAAAYAFGQAEKLAPGHPAPRFFKGLALVRSGQIEEGAALWQSVLSAAPANATWRPMIEDALLAIGRPVGPKPDRP
jgi:cytochrome c-type biogenesis protein CcmH